MPPPAAIFWPRTSFSPGVVRAVVEDEVAGQAHADVAARVCDSPAGEGARDFLHVPLRVAAFDAERVQLHQLARVVLVDAAARSLLLRALLLHLALLAAHTGVVGFAHAAPVHPPFVAAFVIVAAAGRVHHPPQALPSAGAARVRIDALEVVEVEEHGGAFRGRFEQVAEVAERVGANHVAVVRSQIPAVGALRRVDVEVVRPEIDHHLLQLPLAVDRAQDARRL